MSNQGNWTEKDEVTINAIIVNMINQKRIFRDLGENSDLPTSFKIQNSKEYILGIFTGIVINLFANYWISEHQFGLSSTDLDYLYHKISKSHKMIVAGLFE